MKHQQHRNPVLLVHGIFRQSGVFRKMEEDLRRRGWSAYALNLSLNNFNFGIEELAREVADYVDRTFPPEQPFDLVGLSMGGIVSRYYMQRLGGIERVQRFITLSAPHHGTWMAYALRRPTCVQMRPNSDLLADLNRDATLLERVNFTSIWTDWDFIIVPASSSQMSVGKQVKLPVFAHAMMVRHRKSLQAVVQALETPVADKCGVSRLN
ncbi:esterase/lipase family protein [Phormidium sp. CCY1219]|uniref:esterase/lipase family protein n=1 Tax=Phormidium sp. CCY1219 TaxID=2886104 RepID=UPI002D1F7FED|nr:alpha/beta fold hydrolase [Phormidium sp. CCY1219]MEB3826112.1 alpha/beta fold hydrolase [Phormidium sp. CCY1219]